MAKRSKAKRRRSAKSKLRAEADVTRKGKLTAKAKDKIQGKKSGSPIALAASQRRAGTAGKTKAEIQKKAARKKVQIPSNPSLVRPSLDYALFALHTPKAHGILGPMISPKPNSWTRGGCCVFAMAMQEYLGRGEIMMIVRGNRVVHVVLKAGGKYVDAKGRHTKADLLGDWDAPGLRAQMMEFDARAAKRSGVKCPKPTKIVRFLHKSQAEADQMQRHSKEVLKIYKRHGAVENPPRAPEPTRITRMALLAMRAKKKTGIPLSRGDMNSLRKIKGRIEGEIEVSMLYGYPQERENMRYALNQVEHLMRKGNPSRRSRAKSRRKARRISAESYEEALKRKAKNPRSAPKSIGPWRRQGGVIHIPEVRGKAIHYKMAGREVFLYVYYWDNGAPHDPGLQGHAQIDLKHPDGWHYGGDHKSWHPAKAMTLNEVIQAAAKWGTRKAEGMKDPPRSSLPRRKVAKNNPTKKKTTRRKTPPYQLLINRCQKLWTHYCERPSKKRLEAIYVHLDKMKESKSQKVKTERSKCLRAANAEAKRLKYKRP